MADLSKFIKGLTTEHVGAVWVLCGVVFWVAKIEPSIQKTQDAHQGLTKEVSRIADTFDGFRKEVADIRTEVKIHGVLIASMDELRKDVKDLSQKISLVQAKSAIATP